MFGDSLSGGEEASAGAVPVEVAGDEAVLHGLHHLGGRLQVPEHRRVPNGQRDHFLLRVRSDVHGLEDVSDRVEGVLGDDGGLDAPVVEVSRAGHLRPKV